MSKHKKFKIKKVSTQFITDPYGMPMVISLGDTLPTVTVSMSLSSFKSILDSSAYAYQMQNCGNIATGINRIIASLETTTNE